MYVYMFQVKTFMLKNPSSSVVSVEIRVLSLYPAPLEALDLLTKWYTVKSICCFVPRLFGALRHVAPAHPSSWFIKLFSLF